MVLAGLEDFERRHVYLTGLAAAIGTLVLVVYFTVPVSNSRIRRCSSAWRWALRSSSPCFAA
jgi:hypothetical protein